MFVYVNLYDLVKSLHCCAKYRT